MGHGHVHSVVIGHVQAWLPHPWWGRPLHALNVFGDMVTAAPMVKPPADLPWIARRSGLVQPSCDTRSGSCI